MSKFTSPTAPLPSPPVVNVKRTRLKVEVKATFARRRKKGGEKNMDGVRAREAPRAAAVTRGDRRGGVLIG